MSGPARVVLVLLAVSAIAAQAVLESPVYRRPPGEEPVVSLYRHGTGERRTIPMEEYVAGVVAAEMDPRWPVEALAAQAVIARTFAVERLARGGVRGVHGTDVCDDPGHFQAYDPDAITPQVRRAVARTRGLVLTYGGGAGSGLLPRPFRRLHRHAPGGGRLPRRSSLPAGASGPLQRR